MAGKAHPGEEIWVRRSTVTQQWAREVHQEGGTPTLPAKYQQHE